MSDTFEKIAEVIADKLGVEPAKITPEAKFVMTRDSGRGEAASDE